MLAILKAIGVTILVIAGSMIAVPLGVLLLCTAKFLIVLWVVYYLFFDE